MADDIDLTKESGATQVEHEGSALILKPEHYESLKALKDSPHWRIYANILMQCATATYRSTALLEDPYKIIKLNGKANGLEYAVLNLGSICQKYEEAVKKKQDLAKRDKKDLPFTRG